MTSSRPVIDETIVARYKKWAGWTLVTLYLLILIGGIVRASGSGMGCPDWPRCFGSWVPPTAVSQLPDNYKEIYGAKLKGEVEFNPVKTWIEYINRLFGVFTGGWIFLTLLASIPFLRSGRQSIFYLSLSAFLLVAFQGWLGSKVVSTELHPLMVTLHMLLAIVIVFVLLFAFAKVSYIDRINLERVQGGALKGWVVGAMVVTLAQVVLGTQVREAIDIEALRNGYAQRDSWIEGVGNIYLVHRSFSIVVLVSGLATIYFVRKTTDRKGILNRMANWMLTVLLIEIGSGVVLGYFAIPAVLQPIHLTLSIVLLGIQFVLYLFLNAERIFKTRQAGGTAAG